MIDKAGRAKKQKISESGAVRLAVFRLAYLPTEIKVFLITILPNFVIN
jgi:hypothetical protein